MKEFFYRWASLVAQMINNLPAMQETQVQSLSWEDSLEKGKATRSIILVWKTPRQRSLVVQPMGLHRVRHDEHPQDKMCTTI